MFVLYLPYTCKEMSFVWYKVLLNVGFLLLLLRGSLPSADVWRCFRICIPSLEEKVVSCLCPPSCLSCHPSSSKAPSLPVIRITCMPTPQPRWLRSIFLGLSSASQTRGSNGAYKRLNLVFLLRLNRVYDYITNTICGLIIKSYISTQHNAWPHYDFFSDIYGSYMSDKVFPGSQI